MLSLSKQRIKLLGARKGQRIVGCVEQDIELDARRDSLPGILRGKDLCAHKQLDTLSARRERHIKNS